MVENLPCRRWPALLLLLLLEGLGLLERLGLGLGEEVAVRRGARRQLERQ